MLLHSHSDSEARQSFLGKRCMRRYRGNIHLVNRTRKRQDCSATKVPRSCFSHLKGTEPIYHHPATGHHHGARIYHPTPDYHIPFLQRHEFERLSWPLTTHPTPSPDHLTITTLCRGAPARSCPPSTFPIYQHLIYITTPIDHRDDIPESEQLPQEFFILSTIYPDMRSERVLTARPTRDPAEAVYIDSTYDRGRRSTLGSYELADSKIGIHRTCMPTRDAHMQTELAALRETDRRRQDQMVETLRVIRDMRREMSDMQAELLALREQPSIAGQSGPEARISGHQEASRDADSAALTWGKNQPLSPTSTLSKRQNVVQSLKHGQTKEAYGDPYTSATVPSLPQWPCTPEDTQERLSKNLKKMGEMGIPSMVYGSWECRNREMHLETAQMRMRHGLGIIVKIDTIIRGCTLKFLGHPSHRPNARKLGSFDVIIGMGLVKKISRCDHLCLKKHVQGMPVFLVTYNRQEGGGPVRKGTNRGLPLVLRFPRSISRGHARHTTELTGGIPNDLVPELHPNSSDHIRLAPSEMKNISNKYRAF
ncbi:hypothetical protein Tco_0751382 [Tanacetum coccineum]|uniref:Uncharacterized protein n=1 Tax=Tanacetum coccineum TaxID=301880 RepID=A0ABQ4Z6I1_9ASTR